MKRLTLALTAVSLVFLTAGCGQSGPLYIPGDPSTISQPPPQQDTAEEDTDKTGNE